MPGFAPARVVRFEGWQVRGDVQQGAAKAEVPWWNEHWQWRIPLKIQEPGDDDRRQAIALVRLDFAGRAHAFEPRADGSFSATDVVVVNAENQPAPSWVTPIRVGQKEGATVVDCAEIRFPVDVSWCQSVEYFVYFGNPDAPRRQAEAWRTDVESFAALGAGDLPGRWRCISGQWQSRPLTRPESRRCAVLHRVRSARGLSRNLQDEAGHAAGGLPGRI